MRMWCVSRNSFVDDVFTEFGYVPKPKQDDTAGEVRELKSLVEKLSEKIDRMDAFIRSGGHRHGRDGYGESGGSGDEGKGESV